MKRKNLSVIMLVLLVTGMLTLAFNVQPVKSDYTWTETIYIRADGSVEPSDAPISKVDNDTYTLTDNIVGNVPDGTSAIVVERDNIVIDGGGCTLQGSRDGTGIKIYGRSNVTIKNMTIGTFEYGIYFSNSSGSISGNNITNNKNYGVYLHNSFNNTVSGNNMTNNGFSGIGLFMGSDNTIFGNNITNNTEGISLFYSSSNGISGNDITSNSRGVTLYKSSNNNISGNIFVGDGLIASDSYGNVVVDNLVNGKPLVYLENASDMTVEDAGQVILVNCSRIRVENLNLSNTDMGIQLRKTNDTTITGNNITNNIEGIFLGYSSGNNISRNNITNNTYGIVLSSSSSNCISRNNIINNYCGVYLGGSSNNFYHNNFINNAQQVEIPYPWLCNVWDDGYPSGGNYWSDFTGVDNNADGIGDTPNIIATNNTDRYPLIGMFNTFDAGTWNGETYNVDVVSNSTVSNFKINETEKTLSFNVSGVEGNFGFCRITIPNTIIENLWQGNYTVLLNGEPSPFKNWTDTKNTYIYINYTHSTHQITIIPEFSSTITLPLLMLTTLVATILPKKKRKPALP